MSIFESVVQDIATAGQEFDRMGRKIELLREYSMADYKIECGNAELAELTESASMEDTFDAYEEAGSKVKEKFKKLVKSNEKNAKEYFDKTEKSLTKLEEADYKKVIKSAESAFKANPDLGRTKVEVTDYDGEIKAINQGIEDAEKLEAKVKSRKKVTDADRNELKRIVNDTNKKRDRAKTAKIAITAVAAVGILSAGIVAAKKNASSKKMNLNTVTQSLDGLDTKDADFIVNVHNEVNRLHKEQSAVHVRKLVGIRNSLRKMVGAKLGKRVTESHEGMDEEFEAYSEFNESELEPITWENDFDSAMVLQDVIEQVQDEELVANTDTLNESEEMEDNMSYLDDELLKDFDESAEEEEFDIEALLEEAAEEAGLSDGEEKPHEESADDDIDFDVEALLEEAAEEAGLNDDSVDSLLENFEESMNL